MNWKNQLTKTPYLVLFIVLISIGVGTASALITITLAGDVHITGDTTVDGELKIGTNNPSDDDVIRFDSGNEWIKWDESETFFRFSDTVSTGGHAQFGSVIPDNVNRFGDGTPTAPESMTGFGDLYLADDLEVTSDVYVGGQVNCTNCILGFYVVKESVSNAPAPTKSFALGCDGGDIATGGGARSLSSSNSELEMSFPAKSGGALDTDDGDVPTAWFSQFTITNSADLNGYVVCADYAPVHTP